MTGYNSIWITCKLIKGYLFHQNKASAIFPKLFYQHKKSNKHIFAIKESFIFPDCFRLSRSIHTCSVIIKKICELSMCGPQSSEYLRILWMQAVTIISSSSLVVSSFLKLFTYLRSFDRYTNVLVIFDSVIIDILKNLSISCFPS